MKPFVLAIDIGGTKIAATFFHRGRRQGDVYRALLRDSTDTNPANVILTTLQHGFQLAARLNGYISSIGIAIPGIYYAETGRVWAPNIPGWTDFPLADWIKSHLPDSEIPVVVDSDRACSILGETRFGNAKNCKNAVFLAVGTGIGAGILVDGKILRGSGDIAGATGWMALSDSYLPPYKDVGCFEYHASGQGLAMVMQAILQKEGSTGYWKQTDLRNIRAQDVFHAFDAGDPLAERAIQDAVRYWGKAAANFVSLFNPEKIIFGGGVFGPATQFLPQIYEEACRWAQPISIRQVTFTASSLGPDAVLYGAAALPSLNKRKT